ncbi:aminopeptidase [Camelliibacillus cellulosilyticus]|uniref:Aminopeptidase n=1 Tax=Camelliibacillus cellulosilyticus TaxID=2174486 RepID=A0ABV9GLQ0_9BACL
MEAFQTALQNYAELAVKIGVNVQKGQTLVVNAPVSALDFVRQVVKKAYEAGAKTVYVEWNDQVISRMAYDYAPMEAFEEFPTWKADGMEKLASQGAAFLSIAAPNPELLKGVDPKKIALAQKTAGQAMKAYAKYTKAGKVSWSIVAVPTPEWASKVFPDLDEAEAIDALWKQIFHVTRVADGKAVENWQTHTNNIAQKLAFLNDKQLKSLHYQSSGTDLTLALPENHVWMGGSVANTDGVNFVPNIPTEEVFCAPKKTGVNGTVRSTKPLNYGGQLIENIAITFKEGRIVDFHADTGYEVLKNLIETDEGSHYLGEIALVPHQSPISDTGLIFFNTLFDENASCHLAIGSAYAMNLIDGGKMSDEELEAHGLNTSITHVDFMIGSPDLNIEGITASGESITIFKNGNWAI